MAFRNIDVSTTTCGICMVPLANWPGSEDDWATPNLSLTLLPCGHFFHTECLCARRVHLECDEQTGGVEAKSAPCVASVCPLCRAPWSLQTADEHILGDFESTSQCASDAEDDCQKEGDDEESYHEETPEEEPMRWTRYWDPQTQKVFWAKPDEWTKDEGEAFWEDGGKWVHYTAQTGEACWAHAADETLWFYVRSGTQKLPRGRCELGGRSETCSRCSKEHIET